MSTNRETIAAIATAPGSGGIGIVRISGPLSADVAVAMLGCVPPNRHALVSILKDGERELDQCVALFFSGPNSYTGDDVLEFQCHGGQVVLDMVLRAVLRNGCRAARPGEFTERAYLNGRMDLTQAEAVCDLINAATEDAVRGSLRSLQGAFSKQVENLVGLLVELRIHVEAAIDFPDEELELLQEARLGDKLSNLLTKFEEITRCTRQGQLLRDGIRIALVGAPNAGKSSLLNCLLGYDRAIVSADAGTTRDTIRETLVLDGMPIHLVDTAGLREGLGGVEKEGISRTWKEVESADFLLVLEDSSIPAPPDGTVERSVLQELLAAGVSSQKIIRVRTKTDISGEDVGISAGHSNIVGISVVAGRGIDDLLDLLRKASGYDQVSEGTYVARRRHLEGLHGAEGKIRAAMSLFETGHFSELLAEELLQAQKQLEVITGKFSSDNLLGEIFAGFCIGK